MVRLDIFFVVQALHDLTGHAVHWKNSIEVEWVQKKRAWLRVFSVPEVLAKDVTDLDNEFIHNFMDGQQVMVPLNAFIYTFGYYCKDLSSLNNHAGDYKADCLITGKGSTGKTWLGNLSYVRRARPVLLLIENVPAARSGPNYAKMVADLKELGYVMVDLILNSVDASFPQDRSRAWFAAARNDTAVDLWKEKFLRIVESMKLGTPMPFSRFLLKHNSPYLFKVFEAKRKRAKILKARSGAREVASAKAKAKASPKNKAKRGTAWKIDHWRARRLLNMPAPSSKEPDAVTSVAEWSCLGDRERDILRIVYEGPVPCGSAETPSMEMKHSVQRVVHHALAKHRRQQCTSCLLPSSKILLWPPVVQMPRLLTGLEALALQGVPLHFDSATGSVLSDTDYMGLAGNAFNGGCMAMMLVAALASLKLTYL